MTAVVLNRRNLLAAGKDRLPAFQSVEWDKALGWLKTRTGADLAARQKALQCLRNRQGQARSALETIRPLTKWRLASGRSGMDAARRSSSTRARSRSAPVCRAN